MMYWLSLCADALLTRKLASDFLFVAKKNGICDGAVGKEVIKEDTESLPSGLRNSFVATPLRNRGGFDADV